MLEENLFRPPASEVKDYEEKVEGYVLATRGSRLAAVILDGLIFWGLAILIGLIAGLDFLARSWMFAWLGSFIFLGLNLYLIFKHQQTLGKRIMRIKIVRKDFSPCSGGRIIGMRLLLMWFLGSIPFVGPVIGLLDPLFIFRNSHYCLHDDIADTCVVQVAK